MKKLLFMLTMLLTTGSLAFSQAVKSPEVTVEGKNVKVVYGQPSKRGRVIFGELVPYGQVWRTGANKATEITFAKDATFGGKPVKAGTYSLFTIPEKEEWTIILNSALKQWGAYDYEKIKDKNVLEVKVPAAATKAEVEKFTITLPANQLVLEWDKTKVSVPVK
ncbi:DUF2911 domain-containing protein [Chitinophaga pendula]|uniref:DUF2911 domain-containing protein n=1 Tax=Chitinophaga TaxID=79328 RepID=UPI000BB05C23|nr:MULTISPECIES: DUF2911 domain-containing protein [Chitinophaga]ASZ12081.1 hypothetical protein CK934_14485 [Chitinophaga sp. MD30]UCJ04881.1 DUF2911 domain-containing protein [Chitinophaga pendula]